MGEDFLGGFEAGFEGRGGEGCELGWVSVFMGLEFEGRGVRLVNKGIRSGMYLF